MRSKDLFHIPVVQKNMNFVWRASRNIIPIRQNLKRNGITDEDVCPCCGDNSETIHHALLRCDHRQGESGLHLGYLLELIPLSQISLTGLTLGLCPKKSRGNKLLLLSHMGHFANSQRRNIGFFVNKKKILQQTLPVADSLYYQANKSTDHNHTY